MVALPAFDLNPNPESGRKLLSTAIDGSSNEASLETLLEVADLFRLDPKEARTVLREVSEATSRWREVARRAGLKPESIAQMEPAFEHGSARAARELDRLS